MGGVSTPAFAGTGSVGGKCHGPPVPVPTSPGLANALTRSAGFRIKVPGHPRADNPATPICRIFQAPDRREAGGAGAQVSVPGAGRTG